MDSCKTQADDAAVSWQPVTLPCDAAAQAKAPIVEVLEERLMKAAEDRADAAAAAAADDDREELEAAQVRVYKQLADAIPSRMWR